MSRPALAAAGITADTQSRLIPSGPDGRGAETVGMLPTFRAIRQSCAALLVVVTTVVGGAPLLDASRTSIDYGRTASGVESLQPVFLTNVGDAPLSLSAFTLTGPSASDLRTSGTCAVPSVLAPGGRCRLDVIANLTSSASTARLAIESDAANGPFAVQLLGVLSPDLQVGLYAEPGWVDFDPQEVGTTSAARTIAFINPEGGTHGATLDAVELDGKNSSDFTLTSDCVLGRRYINRQGCTATLAFTPTTHGPRATQISFAVHPDGGAPRFATFSYSITGVGGTVPPVDVVEYYNASLDHYFITWNAAEQANLDAGKTPTRWTRTGYAFRAYASPLPATSPVCRYYLPPAYGDSHFFGRGKAECDATGASHPAFVLEDSQFMHMVLPVAGNCPASTTPIYRVFSNRADANHRYTSDRGVRDQMVAQGWLAEGDGPDLVVMCAP